MKIYAHATTDLYACIICGRYVDDNITVSMVTKTLHSVCKCSL